MDVDDIILATIAAIYDAGLEPTRWQEALDLLAKLTHSQAATFWVLGGNGKPELSEFSYVNFDASFIGEYLDGMSREDPTVQFLLSHPDVSIIHDGQYLSERDIDSHPYYDWHLRHTDARYRLLGQMQPGPGIQAGVTLHRARESGRFDTEDLALFQSVYPHLQRSLTISFRMGSLNTKYRAVVDLLDRDRTAMLLLDTRGRLIHHNSKLDALVKENDGIQLNSRGLVIKNAEYDQRLKNLIAMACTKRPGNCVGGSLQIPRPSGKRPYQVLVTPVPKCETQLSAWPPAVCIAITDPVVDPNKVLPTLKDIFGLTASEGCLACLLASGEDLHVAADRLGIQYGTARARLANIFQKTDTHRQGELIHLLLITLLLL